MVAVILFYKVEYIYSLAVRACGTGQIDGRYQNYYFPTSQSIMIRVVSASGKQLERDESIFMIFISYILIIHCLLPEAGFTMLLHADLLSWDNRILPADKTFPVEAEWKRKEYLYHKIIYYFDRGKVSWVHHRYVKLLSCKCHAKCDLICWVFWSREEVLVRSNSQPAVHVLWTWCSIKMKQLDMCMWAHLWVSWTLIFCPLLKGLRQRKWDKTLALWPKMKIQLNILYICMLIRAGTSPTFWTRGLASLGLAGTRGLASPIEELLSFNTSPSLPRSEQ